MDISESAPACPARTGNAINFVQEVQSRFEPNRPELYQRFLQAFTDIFTAPQTRPDQLPPAEETVAAIHNKMKDIFKDDMDLLERFEAFMPSSLKLAGDKGSSTVQMSTEELEPEEVD
ncbi:hypothetical protein C8A01DRAFT_39112 [Parachaetomium inaequale]|uniref:Uncharacterized protein n=1 Tax=Parachaetomium inaequale TaxID=2588326 RepID=A0AAN6PBM2_9PEZI|nr:hypothetical protein C8A01DRAFT_39112 [Parachaetomium inaequale]